MYTIEAELDVALKHCDSGLVLSRE